MTSKWKACTVTHVNLRNIPRLVIWSFEKDPALSTLALANFLTSWSKLTRYAFHSSLGKQLVCMRAPNLSRTLFSIMSSKAAASDRDRETLVPSHEIFGPTTEADHEGLITPNISYGLPLDEAMVKHMASDSKVYVPASKTLSEKTNSLGRLKAALGNRVKGLRVGITPHTVFQKCLEVTDRLSQSGRSRHNCQPRGRVALRRGMAARSSVIIYDPWLAQMTSKSVCLQSGVRESTTPSNRCFRPTSSRNLRRKPQGPSAPPAEPPRPRGQGQPQGPPQLPARGLPGDPSNILGRACCSELWHRAHDGPDWGRAWRD